MKLARFIEETGLNEPVIIAVLVFVLIALAYIPGEPVFSDSKWAVPAAYSLIHEHNYDVDEYPQLIKAVGPGGLSDVNGRHYPGSPVGVSLAAVPFVYVTSLFTDLSSFLNHSFPTFLDHFIAAVYTALAAAFIFLIGQHLLNKQLPALLLAIFFAFGTSAWSTASLALWQHGPSMLLLAITLYLLLRAEKKPSMAIYTAFPLAFSFIVRPTNFIPCILLTVYVFIRFRKYILRYLLGAAFVAAFFVLFNFHTYGTLFSPYYGGSASYLSINNFLAGLAGQLISPARGLLVFSPILILSFYGIFLKIKKKSLTQLDFFLIAIIACHWVLISLITPWWGGHSFGPRYFSDMLPFLMYFMIPALSQLKKPFTRQIAFSLLISVLFGISVFANFQGAYNDTARDWNVHPQIFDNQWRIWDWSDIPYMRTTYDK